MCFPRKFLLQMVSMFTVDRDLALCQCRAMLGQQSCCCKHITICSTDVHVFLRYTQYKHCIGSCCCSRSCHQFHNWHRQMSSLDADPPRQLGCSWMVATPHAYASTSWSLATYLEGSCWKSLHGTTVLAVDCLSMHHPGHNTKRPHEGCSDKP